jgi:hypothetical protein
MGHWRPAPSATSNCPLQHPLEFILQPVLVLLAQFCICGGTPNVMLPPVLFC